MEHAELKLKLKLTPKIQLTGLPTKNVNVKIGARSPVYFNACLLP